MHSSKSNRENNPLPLRYTSAPSESREISALSISLLIHLLFLVSWLQVSNKPAKEIIQTVKVNLVRPKESPKIVAPSEAEESKIIPDTLKLSDKNTLVREETLKRGDAPNLANTKSAQAQKKSIAKKKSIVKPQKTSEPQEVKKSKTLESPILSLSPSEISKQLQSRPTKTNEPSNQQVTKIREQTDYSPFRRALSPSVSGRLGSPDYLPTIQDGEINLLNAKADRYAVFVRRVALQVFGILRQKSWSNLTRGQIYQLRQFSEVRAVLNPRGDLIRLELGGSSGVLEFDTLLKEAANRGAWDKNPPVGAQSVDGNIHFIFRAKTWSRASASGVGEQRWLLLSSGLL